MASWDPGAINIRHISSYGRVARAIVVVGVALPLPLLVAQENCRAATPPPLRFKSGGSAPAVSRLLVEILATTNAGPWALIGEPATITSLNDDIHLAGSLHYRYRPADFRTRHWQTAQCQPFAWLVQAALGTELAVLFESDPSPRHVSHRLGSLELPVGVGGEQEVSPPHPKGSLGSEKRTSR